MLFLSTIQPRRTWWFTTSIDREHTFEGLVRFFEAAGGIPGSGARTAAEQAGLARAAGRPYLRVVPQLPDEAPRAVVALELPDGDFAVEPIDLAARYGPLPRLAAVRAPTVLIVGAEDRLVLALNAAPKHNAACGNRLVVAAAGLARDWFVEHPSAAATPAGPARKGGG